MNKKKSRRIKYQESGGGWGNPLMGRVFDSDRDLPEKKLTKLNELVEKCNLLESGELQGKPPTDTPTFELRVEGNDTTMKLVGDMHRADDKLRSLISFIRKYSRKEILE